MPASPSLPTPPTPPAPTHAPDLKRILKITLIVILGVTFFSTLLAAIIGYVVVNSVLKPGLERLPDLTHRGRELIRQINPDWEQRLSENEARIQRLEQQLQQLQRETSPH